MGKLHFSLSHNVGSPSQGKTSSSISNIQTWTIQTWKNTTLAQCSVWRARSALYTKLSTKMVGGKQIILVFLFLQPLLSQEEDCDPVFGDCEDTYTDNEECDDVRRSFILVNCHLKFF